MLRKDVKDIINFHLDHFGRGFKYDCQVYRDGARKHIRNITELKKKAKEGDEVRVDVLRGHQGRWGGELMDTLRFEISEENIELAEDYRDRNSRDVFLNSPQDSQKQRVYNWEKRSVGEFKSDRLENLDDAKSFVENVFEEYDLTPPHLKYHAGRTKSCSYFSSFHEIRIGDWGFSKPVLIHESAHGFVAQLGLDRFVSSHGPLFLGIYIELLDKFLSYCDREELQTEASYFYNLDYIEDVDYDYWKYVKKNDRKLDLGDLNRLRQTEYVSSDGTELTESQKDALKMVSQNSNQKVDGRSANALVRRSLLEKNNGGYKLTEKGEKAIEYLNFK